MAKVYVKKKTVKSLVAVVHPLCWFTNRVGKDVFYRALVGDSYVRRYIRVDSDEHAKSLYVHQNVSGKRYFL